MLHPQKGRLAGRTSAGRTSAGRTSAGRTRKDRILPSLATSTQWIDAHSHWMDLRLDSSRETWMREALDKGMIFTLQGGIGPEDWERQLAFQKAYPSQVGLCFGLHPYWVNEHSEGELEEALDLLSQKLAPALAIGETGLDLRPQYEDSFDRQINAFESQLEFSEITGKPLVLHLVQAFEEALQILDFWEVASRRGFVHSFNGSWPQAEAYIQRGLSISVGGPLIRDSNKRLKQAVQNIPMEFLLLETDLPDQPGDAWKGGLNSPLSLLAVAEEVARLKKLSLEEVLQITRQNFNTLFQVSL